MVELTHPLFAGAVTARRPGWALPVPQPAPAALPPYLQACARLESTPPSTPLPATPLGLLTMAVAGASLALRGPAAGGPAAAAGALLVALARRSLVFALALAPTLFLAAKRDALLRLPRRRVVAAWMLHLVATGVALGGACCASDSLQCFVGGSDGHWALNASVRVLHAVLSRPALWAAGLPAESLPLPVTDPRAECWMLCMLCAAALTAPTIVYVTVAKSSRALPPGAAAFVSVCLLSGLWQALGVVGAWAF